MYALDPVRDRLHAILSGGYGASGGLGAEAARRAIRAERFRRGVLGAPLDEPGEPRAGFDRAYELAWDSVGDEPAATNDLDPRALRAVLVTLLVGYVHGAGSEAFVSLAAGTAERADVAVLEPRARALADAERIRRALGWHELTAGTDPAIVDCGRDGASQLDDLGGGRLLCATRYRLVIDLDLAKTYDP